MRDPEPAFDLARFVDAQSRGTYERALHELEAGRKRTHWMWFVFPQLRGLGSSDMARHYGISGLDEARAYLHHEVLGPRLQECAAAALRSAGRSSAEELFGFPDHLKFRSSATLFAAVAGPSSVFQRVLDTFFGGEADPRTLALLAHEGRGGAAS
ncbi:MAG TPA: DUF1810 domain-containing protein [Gemmatimonadaceae bacterium]